MHGRSAGVISPPHENEFHASLPRDCFDYRQGIIERFENRSLFDVEFQISQDFVTQYGTRQLRRVQSEVLDGCAQ